MSIDGNRKAVKILIKIGMYNSSIRFSNRSYIGNRLFLMIFYNATVLIL